MNIDFKAKNISLSIASFITILFFIYNFMLMSNGHFHEDAYILFIYVENFLNGNGITYYPSGPHIEGATDFLWLCLLILLGKIGIDTGTSVILLNSMGVFIITYILTHEILNAKIVNKKYLLFLFPFIFLWMLQRPLMAAVGGFSVYLYIALVLMAFVSVYRDKYLLYTPYLGLTIALFRPDGVIIGIGYAVIGLYKAYRKNLLKTYLIGIIIGILIGLLYFLWRYNYFDNLLPLPLYVKGHGELTAGLHENLSWITKHFHILIPLLFMLVLHKKIKFFLIYASPVLALFAALMVATQSQNIGFRFQAPVFIVAYFFLLILLIEYFENNPILKRSVKIIFSVYLFIMVFIGIKNLYKTGEVTDFNYINQVPLALNDLLPAGAKIAVTEAGRIAYWNQIGNHIIIDIVGLNSEFPAKNTIGVNYLEFLSPDMLMYHHADQMDVNPLQGTTPVMYIDETKRNVFRNKNLYTDYERENLSKVINASLVATDYLSKHFDKYDIFVVDYTEDKSYSHIYAFSKDLKMKDQLQTTLIKSFNQNSRLSYYEMLEKRSNKELNQ